MTRSAERSLFAIAIPVVVIITAAIASCAVQRVPQPAASAGTVSAERASLIKADSDFMAATHARGVAGWTSWFAENGRQISSKSTVVGHDSITAHMASAFASADDRLDWGADYAEVSADGSLGYTYGHWNAFHRDSVSREMRETGAGRYLTIWRRQSDGSWKVELDTGVR